MLSLQKRVGKYHHDVRVIKSEGASTMYEFRGCTLLQVGYCKFCFSLNTKFSLVFFRARDLQVGACPLPTPGQESLSTTIYRGV